MTIKEKFFIHLIIINLTLLGEIKASKNNRFNKKMSFGNDFNRLFRKGMYFSSYYPFLKIKNLIKNKEKILKIEKFLGEKMLRRPKKKNMFKLFKNCDGGREKLKGILKDFCFINAGRLKYARNDFKGGLNEIEKVKIYSGAWLYLLREKAWFNYKLKNYRRFWFSFNL